MGETQLGLEGTNENYTIIRPDGYTVQPTRFLIGVRIRTHNLSPHFNFKVLAVASGF